jgi:transcriptional regulator with XRE-family HTH domain
MVKISELKTSEEIQSNDMQDPEYRREYERSRLANDVAIRVIQYRVEHGLSQAELARRLGMRQPNVARLESGDHEPTIATLSLLAQVLKQDFSVDVKPSRMSLRRPAQKAGRRAPGRTPVLGRGRALAPAASASSARSSRTSARRPEESGQRSASPKL